MGFFSVKGFSFIPDGKSMSVNREKNPIGFLLSPTFAKKAQLDQDAKDAKRARRRFNWLSEDIKNKQAGRIDWLQQLFDLSVKANKSTRFENTDASLYSDFR